MANKHSKLSHTHYPLLDGLRGLAILLVMIDHFIMFTPTAFWQRPISWIANTGWIGVDLFFVLSGFLITGILIKSLDQPNYFKNFYIRRALRIFPLNYFYIGFFTLALIIAKIFFLNHPNEKIDTALTELPWVWLYATNVLVAIKGHFITASINQFWSLAIEEQFYLIWPALLFFAKNKKNIFKLSIFLFILSIVARALVVLFFENYGPINHVSSVSRFDQFAAGAIASLLIQQKESLQIKKWAPTMTFTFLIGIIFCELLNRFFFFDRGHIEVLEYSVSAICFASLILWLLNTSERSAIHCVFNSTVLKTLGKYSYAIYIFHFPLFIFLNWFFWPRVALLVPALNQDTLTTALYKSIVAGGLTLTIAYLSWHLFEKHFLKLKEKFY